MEIFDINDNILEFVFSFLVFFFMYIRVINEGLESVNIVIIDVNVIDKDIGINVKIVYFMFGDEYGYFKLNLFMVSLIFLLYVIIILRGKLFI